jgi:uncharacterized protein
MSGFDLRSVRPFRQFVLKVCSRCDLACDHCYVYEHADQSWRARPKVISGQTVTTAAERIAEHARQHALPEVRVILHGGEPLLAGVSRLRWTCAELRRVVETSCRLDLRIHTNGVLLGEEFCELFAEQRVGVGISLDGDRAANDRHRRYADGRSSYDQVITAVDRLRSDRYRALYAGLLCTIDVRNDPVATYGALAALEPPLVDFLLPHATHDCPPPAAEPGVTPYADWLIAVYDRWASDSRRVPVRLFESIIATTNGGGSRTEALGLAASDISVIETDGSIEQADSLKVAYDGAPQTGLDISRNSLDEAAAHPAIVARQRGLGGLCTACRDCPVVTSCGGGLYAHRYRTGSGFDNPSVYCADLLKLITHVRRTLHPSHGNHQTGRPVHAMPAAQFDALAAGYGDRLAVGHLIQSQRSINRALLGLVRERAGSADLDAAWDVLTTLDAAGARAFDEVLAHPYLRAWAVRCLAERGGSSDAGAGHLAAIAAAAAIRAGLPAEIPVPVRDGYLHLPTLGRLPARARPGATVTVTTGSGWFAIRAPGGEQAVTLDSPRPEAGWQPVRTLRADEATVALEDTDPYRDCYRGPVASRLAADQAAGWQPRYRQAWDLLTREYPAYAPGLAAGLTTITQLVNDASGQEISATARQAFGAVGAALPVSGGTLALLLMHEFQHMKLGAVLDMFDLCDHSERRMFYAPWRDDPRPLEALLQGTYAHIAVTDFWRLRRHNLAAAEAETAAARFALWRTQTSAAADALADSGSLTSLGVRFVNGMRATLAPWLDEQVPSSADRLARHWAGQHRSRWDQSRP